MLPVKYDAKATQRAINSLDQQVASLSVSFDDLKTTVDAIPTNVSQFASDIATNASNIAANTASITSLNTTVGSHSTAVSTVNSSSSSWDTAYSWGDHSTQGYLTSYTETDPIFSAHAASGITATQISNWDTAYGWGDHSSAGYLTSYTESDPLFFAHAASNVTTTKISNWDTAYGWGDHSGAGYLTSIADGSITTAKLANQSVTGAKIAANTVGSGNLANNSVYTAAIGNNQVTFSKLSDVKDEDNMVSDSASHIATQQSIKAYVDNTVDNKEIEAYAANNNVSQNLTTSTTTVWTEFDTPGYSEDRLHTAKFEFMLTSGSSTFRNDSYFYVTAVNPSAQTAYSLGTATYESAPAQYGRVISFSGDITDKLTAGGSIGLNLDSSSYFADRTVESYYYDNGDNKTYLRYNSYPSDIVSSGSPVEVFFDPFHWASNGSTVYLETYNLELPYSSQNGLFTIETRLGYFSDALTYRLQARELNSGDSLTVNTLRHTLKTRKI